MNFNIYLDDETGRRLKAEAESRGEPRNALIRQAVVEWLDRRVGSQWPAEVMAFRGLGEMPPFEAGRNGLKPPADDPLA